MASLLDSGQDSLNLSKEAQEYVKKKSPKDQDNLNHILRSLPKGHAESYIMGRIHEEKGYPPTAEADKPVKVAQ